jgi:F-box-like
MALDAQSNWNVEMAQPLKIPIRPFEQNPTQPLPAPVSAIIPSYSGREIVLPSEIISHILSYIPRRENTQSTFWACSLVSRAWYSASIALLYHRPYLNGGNFAEFVRTVCPSKNAHVRQSTLAVLVRRLDMGELVHNASRSLTARLLGRFKGNIEEFVAPQASFAINSFAALSKCTKLRHLDLSLISASISNKLLFKTLKSLQELETLFFPRSSSHDQELYTEQAYSWPPKLNALHLAGGIDSHFLQTHVVNAPPSLQRLSIQHCSQVQKPAVIDMLQTIGPLLQHLTIRHPMQQLWVGALDSVLDACPSLTALRISADFISDQMFSSLYIQTPHPLRILDLECSPTAGADVGISASAVYDCVEEGRLPDLRIVRVNARLAWGATERTRTDSSDLGEILEEREIEKPLGIVTGVWWNMPD